jgi:HAD superfamily hydrolase (TIGR01490 family)
MNSGAFFDIDGTLHRNSLLIEHFKKLVKYEVIDPRSWHYSVKYTYGQWRKRERDYEDYMLELIDIYVDALRGRKKDDLEFISEQVIKLNGEIVYKYTRDRILWHKQQGHKVFFISGSPVFLVSRMAAKYGADDFRGARYLTDEAGCFTGEVIPMWDTISKEKAMKQLIRDYDIDLSSSFAYGDTRGDISMLKTVAFPVAINPTRELVDELKRDPDLSSRALIVVERKDVIYQIPPSVTVLDG